MSRLENGITVEYNNKKYVIVFIEHQNHKLPIVLDKYIYGILKVLDRVWYVNDRNYIFCQDNENHIFLHDVVLKIDQKLRSTTYHQNKPIIHINRINFDNRVDNLQYDIPDKAYNKNTRKKKRTISLKKYGIDVDTLPTYMWYLKPDNTHGSRFVIEIKGDISWRSTSSRKVSLRYKLEEAKKYLRYLKKIRPDLFSVYCMNGDLTEQGRILLLEYVAMIKLTGYTMDLPKLNKTDNFIKEDLSGLTDQEIYLLSRYNPGTL